MQRRSLLARAAVLSLLGAAAVAAQAQDYPDKPITLIDVRME